MSKGSASGPRPRLRPVEVIMVTDPREGRLLVLRDTQGIAPGHAALPAALAPIVARFDGQHTYEQIAREASAQVGETVSAELVAQLAAELDKGLYLQSAHFEDVRRKVEEDFVKSDVRPASHAGGAYYADPQKLVRYIEDECLANYAQMNKWSLADDIAAPASNTAPATAKRVVGLIAPHIDPWRGALGYGAAYGALRRALPPEVDTFLVFGTSHAPMRRPFALCRKAYATPLGPFAADTDAIDAIADACDFDPYEDELNHKREHSIEFQAVYLRHLLATQDDAKARKPATIIPVLAGLGDQQTSGRDPSRSKSVERFYAAVKTMMARRPGRVVVVAGADLAHVGPRFGDAAAFDERARRDLETRDRESLARASAHATSDFWEHVAEDLDTRRVCGLAPIYSLLRALDDAPAKGELLHYEQTIDAEDGSIVSHAAMAFHA